MSKENLKKICYITTNGAIGGATVHLLELISKLPADIEIYVVIGEDKDWLWGQLERFNVKRYHLASLVRPISPLQDLKALCQLKKIIGALRPDLIHCHSSKAGILGRIAGHLCGIPVVFTAHGWAFTEGVSSPKRFLYAAIERVVAGFTRTIITVSDYDKALSISVMPNQQDKIVTIHNGISELQRDKPKRNVKREREILKLIMVARFCEPKDHAQLLKALSVLKQEHISFEASLVGDGPLLAEMLSLSKSLNLEKEVRFLGRQTNIEDLLLAQDVFVLTSNWEGFPISILEAMRAGLPVVASDVGGVKEAVVDNVTGFLIPRGNVDFLTERLRQLSQSGKLRHSMGLKGQGRFRQSFTSGEMMRKVMDVYYAV